LSGALVGLLAAAPLIALLFLARQLLALPFPPFDLFDWIARALPGDVITFGIDLMIDSLRALNIDVADVAKTAEQMMAVGQFLAMLVVAAAIAFALARRREADGSLALGLALGAFLGVPALAVNVAIGQSSVPPALRVLWILVAFLAWGGAVGLMHARLRAAPAAAEAAEAEEAWAVERLDRRRFLIRAGATAAVITVAGSGVAAALATSERRRREAALAATEHEDVATAIADMLPNAGDPVAPAPGTRPEYTPLKDHYKVFIRTEPTVIDVAQWSLPIFGLVDSMLMLKLEDLRNNYEAMEQYVTLSCISGRIGTSLIGTTLWTGVSLQDVLADAGVRPEARYVQLKSDDGFYETIDLDLIRQDRRIMLTYDWDGAPLPSEHGAPLRVYIPDRYGMKQPKWITSIEVTDEYRPGYWVERNWDEEAIMNATSVIDTVATEAAYGEGDARLVPIGGIAHAGARGISRVEVRVDGGAWAPAQLRAPLSETTWVIWRYDWPFAAGEHLFEVRCAEGDGTPQVDMFREARPSGSTGIHSVEMEV
jgi:DMSO/TMAO reductase YedYZ molybdopterin-dependent catalytic subunit